MIGYSAELRICIWTGIGGIFILLKPTPSSSTAIELDSEGGRVKGTNKDKEMRVMVMPIVICLALKSCPARGLSIVPLSIVSVLEYARRHLPFPCPTTARNTASTFMEYFEGF